MDAFSIRYKDVKVSFKLLGSLNSSVTGQKIQQILSAPAELKDISNKYPRSKPLDTNRQHIQRTPVSKRTGGGGKENNCHQLSLCFHSSGILSGAFPATIQQFLTYSLSLPFYIQSKLILWANCLVVLIWSIQRVQDFFILYSLKGSNQITVFPLNIICTSANFFFKITAIVYDMDTQKFFIILFPSPTPYCILHIWNQ